METLLKDEFEDLEYLVSHVANAIEGLEQGDNIIYEDQTPHQVQEMVNKLLERKDLLEKQRKILQEIMFAGYGLEKVAEEYRGKMNDLMETL